MACPPYLPPQRDGSGFRSVVAGASGPLQAHAWSPANDTFVAIRGPMPAKVDLYDGRTGAPKMAFGEMRRNTIRFDRFGRFLLLGGFGNLTGNVDVWDMLKGRKIGSTLANATVECEWSPDHRWLLAATTSPRLRVDNCVRVYRYNGDPIMKMDFDELTEVAWRPVPPNAAFRARGVSPGRSAESLGTDAEAARSGAYRPPGCSGALAARLRAERGEASSGKLKKVADSGGPAEGQARKKGGGNDATQQGGASVEDKESELKKNIRKIEKKLRAIDDLKEKLNSGEQLNVSQKAKLDGEAGLRLELDKLQAQANC
eukprot:GHVU01122416.1.p1 GENE.GHVU01122416.1~~GHVU01122416.1.p1  ORF type:complete len:315 (+),score=66.06 GHVU01122416.1:423-1367(+)